MAEPEKTDIYQISMDFTDFQGNRSNRTDYYKVVKEKPGGYVDIEAIGTMDVDLQTGEMSWLPPKENLGKDELPRPLVMKPRYWNTREAIGGNGRIPGGRVLKSKHGGADPNSKEYMGMEECKLSEDVEEAIRQSKTWTHYAVRNTPGSTWPGPTPIGRNAFTKSSSTSSSTTSSSTTTTPAKK